MRVQATLKTHSEKERWRRSAASRTITTARLRRSDRSRLEDATRADEAIALSRLTALTQLILIKSGRVI